MHIHHENTTKIKSIVRGEIKLSIVIIFFVYIWQRDVKYDEIWLSYIGQVDICSSNTGKV